MRRERFLVYSFAAVLLVVMIISVILAGCTSTASESSKTKNQESPTISHYVTTTSSSSSTTRTVTTNCKDVKRFANFFPHIPGYTGTPNAMAGQGIGQSYKNSNTQNLDIVLSISDSTCHGSLITFDQSKQIMPGTILKVKGYPAIRGEYGEAGKMYIIDDIFLEDGLTVEIHTDQGMTKDEAESTLEKFENSIDFNGIRNAF